MSPDSADPLLAHLIPPAAGTAAPLVKEEKDDDKEKDSAGAGQGGQNAQGGVVKANKGMILRKSVEYIR